MVREDIRHKRSERKRARRRHRQAVTMRPVREAQAKRQREGGFHTPGRNLRVENTAMVGVEKSESFFAEFKRFQRIVRKEYAQRVEARRARRRKNPWYSQRRTITWRKVEPTKAQTDRAIRDAVSGDKAKRDARRRKLWVPATFSRKSRNRG